MSATLYHKVERLSLEPSHTHQNMHENSTIIETRRKPRRWVEAEGTMATIVEDLTGEVVEAKEEEDLVLPGFRFHPTDEELVGFYLRRKVEKKRIGIDIIKQVDIYKYEPWDLPGISSVGDKEWYFFCLRGRKYRNIIRPNRVTGSGFWKATGIDRPVYSAGRGNDCVGLKKSLVYYRGSAGKGTKTDWMMHEFRLPFGGSAGKSGGAGNGCSQEAETWTICRVFKRSSSPHKKHSPTSRLQVPSDHSNANTSRAADEPKHSHNICFEDNESNHSIITYSEDTESNNSVMNFAEGNSQLRTGLWNQTVQAPSVTTHPDFFNSNPTDFFFDEGSWDELARTVELAADPSLDYDV